MSPSAGHGPDPDLAVVLRQGRRLIHRAQALAVATAVLAAVAVAALGFGGRALAHGDDGDDGPHDTTTTSGPTTTPTTIGTTELTIATTEVTTGGTATTGGSGTTGTTAGVVAVPAVTGLTQPNAVAVLRNAGLAAITQTAPSNEVPEGIVLSQTPAPGVDVVPGSSVAITVSTGPLPECENGLDDDGDGLIDGADGGCQVGTFEAAEPD